MAFIKGCLLSGVAFIEGCPPSGVAFIEGCPLSGVAFIEGCPLSGVAFIEGVSSVRGGLYERVLFHGLYRGVSSVRGVLYEIVLLFHRRIQRLRLLLIWYSLLWQILGEGGFERCVRLCWSIVHQGNRSPI